MLLADCHFSKDRLVSMEPTVNWIIKEVYRVKPSHILFLGDTLHTRESVNVETMQFLKDFLSAFQKADWKPHIHLLVGNHDMSNRSTRTVNSPSVFNDPHLRTHVYAEITPSKLDDIPVLFIPFHEDQSEIAKYIQENTQDLSKTIAFAHIALDGASTIGITNESNRRHTDPSMTLTTLSPLKFVYSGHFHHHAKYGNNFMYVGSPMQFNFGDVDQPERGYVLFDTANFEHKLVVNPHARHFVSFTWKAVTDALSADPDAFMASIAGMHFRLILNEDVPSPELNGVISTLKDHMNTIKIVKLSRGPSCPQTSLPDVQLDHMKLATDFVNGQRTLQPETKDSHLKYFETKLASLHGDRNVGRFVADLDSVVVHNFLNCKGTRKFDFNVMGYGTFLIEGRNGSGKSLLPDSISWCLFGKLSRPGIGIKEVINNSCLPRYCHITVTFKNGWIVRRSRTDKGQKLRITQPDGKVIEEGTVALTEKRLLSILNIDWNVFSRICVLTSDLVSLFFTANDNDRTEILEQMLGLDIFNNFLEGIQNDLFENKAENSDIDMKKQLSLKDSDHYRELLHEVDSKLESADAHQDSLCESLTDTLSTFHEKEKRLTECKDLWDSKEKQYQETLVKSQEVQAKMSQIKSEIAEIDLKIQSQQSHESNVASLRSRLENVQKSMKSLKLDKSRTKALNEKLEKQKVELANSCHRMEDELETLVHSHEEMLSAEKSHRRVCDDISQSQRKAIDFHESRQNEVQMKFTKTMEEIAECDRKRLEIADAEKRAQSLTNDLKEVQHSINRIEESEIIGNVINSLKTVLKDLPKNDSRETLKTKVLSPLKTYKRSLPENEELKSLRIRLEKLKIELEIEGVCDHVYAGEWEEFERNKSELGLQLVALHMEKIQLVKSHENEIKDAKAAYDACVDNVEASSMKLRELSSKRDHLKSQIADIQLKLAVNSATLSGIRKNIDSCRCDANALQVELDTLVAQVSEDNLENLEKLKDLKVHDLDKLNIEKQSLETTASDSLHDITVKRQQYDKLSLEIRQLETEKVALETELSQLKTQIADWTQQRVEWTEKMDTTLSTLATLEGTLIDLAKKRTTMEFWKNALSDASSKGAFRRFCLSQYLPLVNEHLKHNLQMLHEGDIERLGCHFNESLQLVPDGAGAVSHGQSSQGERKRRQLALLFSLLTLVHHNSNFDAHFMFLDELYDSLDVEGRNAVERWIGGYRETRPRLQTFIITHMNWENEGMIQDRIFVDNGKYQTESGKEFVKLG